jgi:hypothetical protein
MYSESKLPFFRKTYFKNHIIDPFRPKSFLGNFLKLLKELKPKSKKKKIPTILTPILGLSNTKNP